MSRWSGYGRRTVEQTRSIDIGTLRRAGYVENDWIQLPHQTLELVQVPWRFGGQRLYFKCDCGRMVEKLYAPGDQPWRCRHCYRLTYSTRQAVPRHRHIIKAQKIRERLGGSYRVCSMVFLRSRKECIRSGTHGFNGGMMQR